MDRFSVRDGRLEFEDLAVKHGLIPAREYTVWWSRFNNDTEEKTPLAGETTFALPAQFGESPIGEYFAAEIQGGDPKKTVTVYVRKTPDGARVVGVDRTW